MGDADRAARAHLALELGNDAQHRLELGFVGSGGRGDAQPGALYRQDVFIVELK